MLPQINNKSLLECLEADFRVIVDNPDYRENQYLDYKENFAFLEIPKEKKDKVAEKISEFRNDICSFANSDGGYLIYGVTDQDGLANDLPGIDIDNPDHFELNLRNKLIVIQPKTPPLQIHFVPLSTGRYIVVIFIGHDYFAPYIHLEDQKNYKIYKREGNQKVVMGYTELKNMFIQSRVLEDEIEEFRRRRINYFKGIKEEKYSRFVLFHFIPESFLNDRKHLFLIEKKKHICFGSIFANARIDSVSIPCVDGLRYRNSHGDEEGIFYNNGIVEYVLPLTSYVGSIAEGVFFYNEDVWRDIDNVSQGYQALMPKLYGKQRYFGCISTIGCRGVISEESEFKKITTIDRDEIICSPIVFTALEDKDTFYRELKMLHLEFLLSLGIQRDKQITKLIMAITERFNNGLEG